jgi:hypothetical protein
VTTNTGWVRGGTDHDTAECAVATVRPWWRQRGVKTSPAATAWLRIADGGGSQGVRPRLWTTALQRLATETGRRLSVCYLPPGTSPWTKIAHPLCASITQHGRGRSRISPEVLVHLIGNTPTHMGRHLDAALATHR